MTCYNVQVPCRTKFVLLRMLTALIQCRHGCRGSSGLHCPCETAVIGICIAVQEYAEQRCSEQEACYNFGRAAHQLGLLHVALPFYERALAAEPPSESSFADLRREAAHNLVLIYRSTGATGMARQVMREHLTF